MSGWVPAEPLLLFLPLVVAAGVDTYLALLFLGVAPLVGWPAAASGPLADLGSWPAVALAGLLFLAEALAGRVPWAATLWNVANTPVRVVASGLLAHLVLSSSPGAAPYPAALLASVAGALAGGIHLARTGWWLELDLEGVPRRIRLLTAVVEDVLVLSLLVLALERPSAGAVLGGLALLVGALRIPAHLSAGVTAHTLVTAAARGLLGRGRWRDGSALPGRLRAAAGAAGTSSHAVRSSPAAAWGPGIPGRFRRGWLVVGLEGPRLLLGRLRRIEAVPLYGAVASRIRSHPLHTTVDLVFADGRACGIAIPRAGPGPEALRQVFASPEGR